MRLYAPALLIAFAANLHLANAGPLAYAACQTACNGGAVVCYAAAGFTFGATAGLAAPPVILACNAAQGCCMAACTALLFAPTF